MKLPRHRRREREKAAEFQRGMRHALDGRPPDPGRYYEGDFRHLKDGYADGYRHGVELRPTWEEIEAIDRQVNLRSR